MLAKYGRINECSWRLEDMVDIRLDIKKNAFNQNKQR